ncbi:acyl-CoA thioesterase [Azospirillum picis]|uniref:Acyl-CoA thioester hydrolase n=1 Tax=Azospirillum picis TaxID=488438 RepID=A0ABU0MPU0_9PROT|nr:thioesterase family protein [Azospirillum picis]MBP2301675.1 acyl-CoA thioester hydrolase [Azospirillum picis]MDQ0535502.1 acyl-CoA thioester hydrolase [Azospirillum picis]
MTGTPDPHQPDLANPEGYRIWWEERVRFADLDAVGHVNNNAIGVYFEQARVAMLHDCGGFRDDSAWTAVLARSVIDYKAELLYPNTVRIGTRVLRLGTSSLTLGCAIFLGNRCIATQEAVVVIVDKVAHRPTPIPEPLRARLAAA